MTVGEAPGALSESLRRGFLGGRVPTAEGFFGGADIAATARYNGNGFARHIPAGAARLILPAFGTESCGSFLSPL